MSKTFSTFRRQHVLNILDKNSMMMRFCENCIHFKKSCRMNDEFEKCIECVKTSRPCNLISLNIRKYKKLNAKHKMLKETLRQLYEKSSRILCELNEIEKKQQKIMNNKIQNFENIQLNTVFLIISDFLIDLAFEQIVLNNLIVSEEYFNSLFVVEDIDEVFVDNI